MYAPSDYQATADLLLRKMKLVLQGGGNPILLAGRQEVDRRHPITGKQFPVDEPANVQVLQTGSAEVPAMFIIKKLRDGLFVQTGFHVGQRERLSGPVLLLFFRPGFIRQPIHLVKEVPRRRIILFHPADLHEAPAEEKAAVKEEKPAKKTTRKKTVKAAEAAEEKPAKKTARKKTAKAAEAAAEEKPAKKTAGKKTAKAAEAAAEPAKKTTKRTSKKAAEKKGNIEA